MAGWLAGPVWQGEWGYASIHCDFALESLYIYKYSTISPNGYSRIELIIGKSTSFLLNLRTPAAGACDLACCSRVPLHLRILHQITKWVQSNWTIYYEIYECFTQSTYVPLLLVPAGAAGAHGRACMRCLRPEVVHTYSRMLWACVRACVDLRRTRNDNSVTGLVWGRAIPSRHVLNSPTPGPLRPRDVAEAKELLYEWFLGMNFGWRSVIFHLIFSEGFLSVFAIDGDGNFLIEVLMNFF